MISLLLSIPEDVIRNRIVPFIDSKSLVKLDTATLSKEHRPSLLSCVLRDAVLAEEESVQYSIQMTKWLIDRSIHVQWMIFPQTSEPSDIAFATPALSQARFIDIGGCVKLSNESVQTMLRQSSSLRRILFDDCTWLDDQTLQVVADHHRELQEFILGDCPHVTDAGAAYVVSKCEGLVDVQWEKCPLIGVLSMTALARRPVENLFVAKCPAISDDQVIKLVQENQDRLRMLILESNSQLTDRSLLAIAQHCPSLLDLNVSNCNGLTDIGLCTIIQSCQSLVAFRAEESSNISAVVLDCMATHLSPVLEHLWMLQAEDITTEHIAVITQRAPKLEDLRLGNSESINNRAVQLIGANLPNLQTLALLMSSVTLQGVQALIRGCTRLTDISFSLCPGICDRCLEEIAQHCKQLKHLWVSNNVQITDSGVRAIALNCPALESLNLDFTSITDVAVEHLIDCCPALSEVTLQGRAALSHSLTRLAEQRHISLTVGMDDGEDGFNELLQMALETNGGDSEGDDESSENGLDDMESEEDEAV